MALIGQIKYIQIGGNTYEILGGSSGSTVTISRNLTSGTKSATINVDGTDYDIYSVTNTDSNVSQTNTTTSAEYRLLLSSAANDTTATAGAQKSSYLTYNPSTKALVTNGTINGFTLAAACAKAVDSSISAGSTSTNLPTSAAVANLVSTVDKVYIVNLTYYDTIGDDMIFTSSETIDTIKGYLDNGKLVVLKEGHINYYPTGYDRGTSDLIFCGGWSFDICMATYKMNNTYTNYWKRVLNHIGMQNLSISGNRISLSGPGGSSDYSYIDLPVYNGGVS